MGMSGTFPTGLAKFLAVDPNGRLLLSSGTTVKILDTNGAAIQELNPQDNNILVVGLNVVSFLQAYSEENTAINGGSATFDMLRSSASNTDASSTRSLGVLEVNSNLRGFNGTTYDRIKSSGTNSDAVATATLGALHTNAYLRIFNGTTWDRVPGDKTSGVKVQGSVVAQIQDGNSVKIIQITPADALAAAQTSLSTVALLEGYNGTTFDRVRVNTAVPGNTDIGLVTRNAKSSLTGSAPTSATVGVSSASAVSSNASRKGLVLVNTSQNTISLGVGNTAVLNSGITLAPNGVWVMDEYTFSTGAINAIASAASSNLSVHEFT